MKTTEDVKGIAASYAKTVRWSDEDACFVGTLHRLAGDCCHGEDPVEVYRDLEAIAVECVQAALKHELKLPQSKSEDIPDTTPDPAVIRGAMGLSQSEFAKLLGVSVKTLHKWEHRTSRPSGAARSLLRIAAQNPEAVLSACR